MWWEQMENEPSLTIKLIKYKTFSITAKIYKHYTKWCKEIGPFVGGKYVIQEGERHYSEAWYYSLLVLDQNKWHTIYIIHSDDFITFYTKLFSLPRKWRGGHKHWDGKSSLQMSWGKNAFFEKMAIFIQQFLAKGSFVFPMALRVTGPCLFGDCLLRTDSRANLPRKYVWASGRWGAMAGGDKYRVSRIRELITIMKYYCHVSFWWSRHDGRWSDKHQNVCNANIGVTS